MNNLREECCSCGVLTDNKNIYGFICIKCNEAVNRIFKKLIKDKDNGK